MRDPQVTGIVDALKLTAATTDHNRRLLLDIADLLLDAIVDLCQATGHEGIPVDLLDDYAALLAEHTVVVEATLAVAIPDEEEPS